MTFTYGMDLTNTPRDWVRFETGDTDSEAYFLEDEEIAGKLAEYDDDKQRAVLACIRGIIGKLSRPAFTADWLKVDNETAIESYRVLLSEKEAEYGLDIGLSGGWFDEGSVDVTRSDVSE